jgi:hypothetical protein
MENLAVYFRINGDIVILKYSDSRDIEIEDVVNATDYVTEWAQSRNLDINDLSNDDIELLKIELFGFGRIQSLPTNR